MEKLCERIQKELRYTKDRNILGYEKSNTKFF